MVSADTFDRFPDFQRRRQWFIEHRPDLVDSVGPMVVPGANNTLILGLVRPDQLRRMLAYMLDENEFLSPYGVRAVSRYHQDHPLISEPGMARSIGWTTSLANPNQPLWRQLQLARPDLAAGKFSHSVRAEAVSSVLRR